jgi:hypothetical protein
MKTMMLKSLAVFGAVVAIAGAGQAQITNGDFSAGVAGWTEGGFGTIASLANPNGGVLNDGFSTSGNYYWLNNGPGTAVGLSQAFTISAPTSVTVSGLYATRVLGSGTNSFIVQILDDATSTILHQQTFNPTAVGGWTAFNVTSGIVSTSNVRVLLIGQGNGFDDDYMVDDITAAGVAPEPGTLALLGLVALPGVALLRRRK